MGLITKNGQLSKLPSGKRKGLITTNGQLSTLLPFTKVTVAPVEEEAEGYGHAVIGVAAGSISAVMGVATANVSKVNGV
jgi:hypothetical protein